jgi:hypothetical protein
MPTPLAGRTVLTSRQNWFQNRRAKVKQDRKKQANQMNMAMNAPYGGMYGTMPPARTAPYQHQQHPEQIQLHMAMNQEYRPMNAEISPAMLPVQSVDNTSALDLSSQISLQQSYDMQAMRSISETNRPAAYPPSAVMDSLMAAAHGSFMQNPAVSLDTQGVDYSSFDSSGLPSDFSFSVPSDMPNDSAPSHSLYTGYQNLGGMPYAASDLNSSNMMGMPGDAHQSSASLSTHSSPFSGAQTHATPQSSNGPTPPGVASVVSAYSGWTEDPASGTLNQPPEESEDQFTTPYDMNGASSSEHTLPFWAQPGSNQSYNHGFYQQSNISSQVILGSPDHDIARKASAGTLDFEPPPPFHDEMYTRRNSSTSNLAGNFEAIQIRNGTPDEFKQPTSIAQRRKGRPVTLNPGAMRSASYSAPMPSPGGNNDHALRRIRSSGIGNAAGRVQKSQPGSAQRSPMVANFSEAAASPKFARTFSSSSTTTMGQGGSLAPPTPLTPQDMGLYWQNNTVIRPHSVMPEHNSPESMNINWSAESQSAGAFAKSVSPPSTSIDLQQMTQQQYSNDMYRDSPPQSAPATQLNFPRQMYMQHPHMRPGFHSTTDLTIAEPKPSHFRRPSLPDTAQAPVDDTSYYQNGNFNYDDYKDISLTNIAHNVPFAPRPSQAPEFLVHEFRPPPGTDMNGNMYRRPESQAKNYIFANQGPRDFKS